MKNILKKLGSFSLGPIAVGLLGFLMTAAITRIITPDEYGRTGIFQTTQNLVLMVTLLAMDQAYAREYVVTAPQKRDSLLLSALVLPLTVSLILSGIFLLFQMPFSRLLFGSETETAAICLTAAMFPFMVLFRICTLRFRMEERGLLFSGFTILWKALSFGIAIALLLLYEKSFRSVVYALALAEILSGAIAAFAALWNISAQKTGLDREAISTMLRYAIPLLPATMISWIYTSSDQYMLRIISGYTELGLYTAAHKIIAIISILQNSFTALWAPVGLRWYESRKDPVYFDLVMWAIGFVSTVLGLGLLLCKNLVALVLGSGFRMALTIFPFLLLSPILYTVSETSFVGISFSRKTGYNSVISGATAIVNVILNLILIPIWGGRGAAIATGLSYILFFWLRTLISRKLWRSFPLGHFIVNSLILAANCFVHTFLSGSAPYLISAVSIAVLMAVAAPTIKKTWTLLRKLDA